jgi:RNA polymerase sigma-70 factor, ECF subfamily
MRISSCENLAGRVIQTMRSLRIPGMNPTSLPSTASPAFAASEDDRRFVLAVARRIVRDNEAASDVAQDALLTAFRHRHDFRGDAHYRTWLYRIAVTAALSYLRREQARGRRFCALNDESQSSDQTLATAPSSPGTPAQQFAAAQRAATVVEALKALPDHYRSVLELRLCEGLSTQQTARSLGISVATVKIRTFRARRQMQDRLRDDVAAA